MEEYVYFVSLSHSKGFANIEVAQNMPITKFEHIEGIQKIASEKLGAKNPVVINYQLLSHAKQ